ncbi:hypothetical protein [Draconibacterium orientale]|uniref:hypothetical protein n=1 Tax=Draconibacterium orientale TaxID=1168034 RepID=UPI002A0A5322|nr:hypothetical protein [Draconibacterium orientale]
MKKSILIVVVITIAFAFSGCEKDFVEEPIGNIELKSGNSGNDKLTGFDQWGYNWNAHQFNGYLINSWFGDELYPEADWYKQMPPFEGDVEAYLQAHPETAGYPFWMYGDMKLVMHWNEACITTEGVYQYPILDSEAWITFHYSQGEGKNKWSQFQKYVAAKSSYTLDMLDPVNGFGIWYTEEGEEVGYYYLWPDRVLIQVQNAGNIPTYLLETYKSPLFPGLGKHKK